VGRGKIDDLEPVAPDGLHRRHQTDEGDRLADKRVHAEVVGAIDVLLDL